MVRTGQDWLFRRAFSGMRISVRDSQSAAEVVRLGLESPAVLPDAISLLYPRMGAYPHSLESNGKVLLNLLDVTKRPDRHEAEFSPESWGPFCADLVHSLGPRAMGLVVGAEDATFLAELGVTDVVYPQTTAELVGLIKGSDGIFSTRMHPYLLGTMVDVPVLGVPYCGKVRPTAELVGVGHALLEELDVVRVRQQMSSITSADEAWSQAWDLNHSWLQDALGLRT